EKTLKDLGDKVPAASKQEIEDLVAKTRAALGGEDAAAMKAATEALMERLQKLGAEAYQGGAGPAAGGPEAGPGSGPAGGEDVVDGEFKEA
ncbi:MAG: hypothetical protein KIT07_08470, partial [Anaerolineales bacterium]|nr:hypothetical protein [Anaerolineales bacterium]